MISLVTAILISWGVYGPYGRPPPGAYDYPRGPPSVYLPPPPRRRGPDFFERCMIYGDCGHHGPPMPPMRRPPPGPAFPPDYPE